MKGFGVVLIIVSIILFGMAYYKYSTYENSEYLANSLKKNAYVGGDAYNYIINSNYFTGFSVLGSCAFISGVLLIGIENIIERLNPPKEDERKKE